MAHDIASMDAAAMLEAARADVSPAAEVVRLRRGLPLKPPNRLTLLFFMLLIFGLAALVLMPPRSFLFADVPYVEAGVQVVLGLLVLGLTVTLVAKIGPPDERLLLAVWYLRRMFATADDQQMPPIQQSVALSEAKAQQHPQVLWLDDLSRVRGVKRFMWWLDTPQFILLLIAFVWYVRPCFALPLSPVCQPIGAMTLAPYLFWIGSIGVRYLIRGLHTHSSTAVADVVGIRLELGRRRERHIG